MQVQASGQMGQPQLAQPSSQVAQPLSSQGHPSGLAQPSTQMIVASQAPPGFQPQPGLQTQSDLQI